MGESERVIPAKSSQARAITRIEKAVGTGTSPTSKRGTYTLTAAYAVITDGTSPLQVATPTIDARLEAAIFLDTMDTGDVVLIKIQREKSDGSWKDDAIYTFSGAQTNQVLPLNIPFYNGYGVRVMAMQSSGTLRTIAYNFNPYGGQS